MSSTLQLFKFTALQVYDAAVKAIALENANSGARPAMPGGGRRFIRAGMEDFDPTIYPQVCIKSCAPMVTSANGNANNDDDGEEKQTNFQVSWRFPVTIEVNSATCKFPLPPGPTNFTVEVLMPSGKMGASSYSMPQSPTKNKTDEKTGAMNERRVAESWHEYIAMANPLINEIVREAMPNSHYLGFSPEHAKSGSHMTISIEDDEVNELGIHISGPHTHGWGTYKRKTKEWSDLRHKHCGRDSFDRDLGILYDGFNDGKFGDAKIGEESE